MKLIFFIFICLAALIPTADLCGQSIDPASDTIHWYARSDKNLLTNENFTRDAHFISYGNSRIEAVKDGHSRIFSVTSTEGTWPDVTLTGQLIFHVIYNEKEGVLTLQRQDDGVSLILDMTVSSEAGIQQQYFIDHFNRE